MLPAACTLVAHASKASRAKRSAAGIVTPFVSCASTDHGDSQQLSSTASTILRLAVQHTLYIHNHPCTSVRKDFAISTNTNFGQQTWPSVAAQLQTLLQNTTSATYDDVS